MTWSAAAHYLRHNAALTPEYANMHDCNSAPSRNNNKKIVGVRQQSGFICDTTSRSHCTNVFSYIY